MLKWLSIPCIKFQQRNTTIFVNISKLSISLENRLRHKAGRCWGSQGKRKWFFIRLTASQKPFKIRPADNTKAKSFVDTVQNSTRQEIHIDLVMANFGRILHPDSLLGVCKRLLPGWELWIGRSKWFLLRSAKTRAPPTLATWHRVSSASSSASSKAKLNETVACRGSYQSIKQ